MLLGLVGVAQRVGEVQPQVPGAQRRLSAGELVRQAQLGHRVGPRLQLEADEPAGGLVEPGPNRSRPFLVGEGGGDAIDRPE